jgi:cytochrome c6
MKTITLLFGLSLFAFSHVSLAVETNTGEKAFNSICVHCHAKGGNMLAPDKTLHKADLEKNGMNNSAAIVQQITKGKNNMPAFASSFNAQEIEAIAAYVLKQAEADWK